MSERIIPHLQDAIRKVIAQGEQSRGPATKRCAYRGVNKNDEVLCCAVGFLIKDEYYDMEIEGRGVATPEVLSILKKSLGFALEEEEIKYLSRLQNAHDAWGPFDKKSFNETFEEEVRTQIRYCKLPEQCLEALEP